MISCDIELRFDSDATRGSCAARARVADRSRCREISHDRTADQSHEYSTVTIFLARVVVAMEKRRVAGTRSYASYRDRFRPKTCPASGRRSSRAESGVTIDRLLSCFRSRRNGACKPDEQCKSNGRKLFLQSPTARRNAR